MTSSSRICFAHSNVFFECFSQSELILNCVCADATPSHTSLDCQKVLVALCQTFFFLFLLLHFTTHPKFSTLLHPNILIPVQHRILRHILCLSCLSWLSQWFIRTEMTNSCQSKKGTTKPEHLEEWTDAQQWATRGYNNTHFFFLMEWMIVVALLQYQLWQVFFSLRQHGWQRKKHLFFIYMSQVWICVVFFVLNGNLILFFFLQ